MAKYTTIESFKEAAEKVLGMPLTLRHQRKDSYYLDIVSPSGVLILSVYVSNFDEHGFSYGGTAGPYQDLTIAIRNLTEESEPVQ